jgi:formate hydrogenlyase transcriptional activator
MHADTQAPGDDGRQESEDQLRMMIDTMPTLAWSCRPDGTTEFFNQRWLDYTGLSFAEALGSGWKGPIHPDDLGKLMDTWQDLLASGEPGEEEARLRRFDGAYRWFLFRAVPVRDERGRIVRWYGTNTDIEELKRTEALRAGENRLLEMMAGGCPLAKILEALCRLIEETASGSLCSILLIDPTCDRLQLGAAPSLPVSFTAAIQGRPVNLYSGPCGMAASLKQQVIAADVASDSRWDAYGWRALALAHGVRACWSTPVLSSEGKVLGTFAMYSRAAGSPTAYHQHLIHQMTHLAAVAIEQARAAEKLRQDEMELRRIIDAIPQTIVVLGPDGRTLYAHQAMLDYTGLALDEVRAADFRAQVFHPDDVERVHDERQEALTRGLPFANEQRARRHDGQYRWFLIQYNPLRDEQGQILRWYATGTDIDNRKRAEERVRKENLALREELDHASMFEEILGSSPALRKVLAHVAKVVPMDSTVLILGETGTGKELIARAILKRSQRAARAFISVNCAAIPPALLVSELFGHEKGAFTGALQRRLGRFELADGGTLFLDEIGDLPAETQIALLRVLQEREIERVGGSHPIAVDVRVLAATNRDLQAAVAAGTFRQDLFYRLNVFPIQLPALRDRRDDIPLLVEYFIERYAKKAGKKIRTIQKTTLDQFQAYDWPGNIRELQNVIERAVVLCEGETFSVDATWLQPALPREATLHLPLSGLGRVDAQQERAMIEAALADSHGRIAGPAGAAAKLRLPRQTLESKIARLGINKHRFQSGDRRR